MDVKKRVNIKFVQVESSAVKILNPHKLLGMVEYYKLLGFYKETRTNLPYRRENGSKCAG